MDKLTAKIENLENSYTMKEEIDPLKKQIQFILDEIDKIFEFNDGDKIKFLYPELIKMQQSIDKIY